MSKPFERFESELNYLQISLLLDTVLYFEDAPKLLSIPDTRGESVAVPVLAQTLRDILDQLDEEQPQEKKRLVFDFVWIDEAVQQGTLLIVLPSGETREQPVALPSFSAV